MASYSPPRIPRGRNQLGLTVGPPLHAPTAPPVGLRAPAHLFLGAGGGVGIAGGGGVNATDGAHPGVRSPAAASPHAGVPDPYRLLTDAQIEQQAGATVDARISPILKQIADTINARTHAGQDALTSLSQYFSPQLGKLAGIDVAGLQTGIGSQSAIDAAVQQSLTGGGNAAASELGAKLAQINAPDAAGQAAATGQLGAGAGNAALASGSAALSALNAQLTTARDMAGKEPGIGALYGLQASKDLQAQASQNLADQTGQITSQVPGLISDLVSAAQNRELSKADARRSQANSDRTFTEGVREFGVNRTDRQNAAASDRSKPSPSLTTQHNPYLTNSYGEVLTGKDGKPLSNPGYVPPRTVAGKADPLAKPDLSLTKSSGSSVILDGHGNPFLVGGKPLKYAPPASTKPASVPDSIRTLKVAVGTGGWDPKTGALSPEVRAGIKQLTGIDPGPTATRQQLVDAGLAPKPAAPKAPPKVTGTSSSSKFLLNPDGSVKGPNPNYVPPKPRAGADPGKAKAAAIKTANATAQRIVTAGAKRVPVYQTREVTNPTTLEKEPKRVQTGERYSADYYKTIHQIEAAVMDTLSPYMPHSQIIKLAQRYANAAYPAGSSNRPRTADQAEKAAAAPKQAFPKPKQPVKRKPSRPPNPRAPWDSQFPLGAG